LARLWRECHDDIQGSGKLNLLNVSQDKFSKQMAILLFGIFEMSLGFAGVILSDFMPMFNVLTIFSGTAGLVALVFCITQPSNIKVYDVLGMALILAYGTGTLNSLASFAMDGNSLVDSSVMSDYWLSRSLGFATAAAGFLHVVGRLETGGYLFRKFDLSDLQAIRSIWFVGGVTLLLLLFVATGKLGFMGDTSLAAGYSNVSIVSTLVLALVTPTSALSIYLARIDTEKSRKLLFYLFAFILLAAQFGFGRRVFVFAAIINLMVAILAVRPKRYLSFKNLVVLILIALTVQAATTAFFTLRLARYTFKSVTTTPTIIQLVPEAWKIYQDRERLYLAEQISENTSTRSFVLEYLAQMSERSSRIEPLYGKNLARAIVVATPSLFYPSKFNNPLFGAEEDLANVHFRLPVWDASNSVLTASVDDFGEVGFFFLPVIFCVVFSIILRKTGSHAPPITIMLIGVLVCQILISVEVDINAYFSSLPVILIILISSWVLFTINISGGKISIGSKSRKTFPVKTHDTSYSI
jgi:hypothetical protein